MKKRTFIFLLMLAGAFLSGSADAAENARDHYFTGIENLASGHYLKAEAELRQALTLNPYYKEAHLALGQLYTAVGRYEAALDACSQAITIDPFYVESYFTLGQAYYQLEDDSSALSQFNHVLELAPDHRESRLYVAKIERRSGRYVQALRILADLADLFPDYADIYLEQGLIYNKQGELAASRQALRRAFTIAPDNLRFARQYADFLLAHQEFTLADTVYARVLAADQTNAPATFGRAWCAFYRDVALPEAVRQNLLAFNTGNSNYFLGYNAYRQGDEEAASVFLQQAIEMQENDNIGRVLLEKVAISHHRVGTTLRNRLSGWHLERARRYSESGDNLLARFHFETAVTLDPQNAQTRFEYGRYLDRSGFAGLAQRHLNAAVELDPFNAVYQDYYSRVQYNRERALTARMGISVIPPSQPSRAALFIHYTPLDQVVHPGVVELLGRKMAAVIGQNHKFTIVYIHPFDRELTVAEAEAQAAEENADLVIILKLKEEELGGEMDGTFITVTDAYRSYDLHLRSTSNLWSDIISRQLTLSLDQAVAARGEVVRVGERDVLVNLGVIHSLAVGDRIRAGSTPVELKVIEIDEKLAKCVPLNPEEIELLKEHDTAVSVL